MKTTIYILSIFLATHSNFLFANINSAELKRLAPVNPVEADFSDNDLAPASSPTVTFLAPVTPPEADFMDSDSDNLNLIVSDLAPITPAEADFSDSDTTVETVSACLAPIIPAEASFYEIN